MKKLMKLMVALAAIAMAGAAWADSLGTVASTKTIDITKGGTAYTNTVDYGTLYKVVDKLVFKNDTAVTVTAVTYLVSGTVTDQTLNTTVLTTGATAAVSTLGTTNIAQKVKTIFTLGGTNGVAKTAGLEATVYGYGK